MNMARKLNSDDMDTWNTFVKSVIPLGEPIPSDYIPPPLYPIQQKTKVDLHGLSLTDAYRTTMDFVDGASGKYVMVITGLSGQIKKEFKHWFVNHKTVRQIEEMNGGGAYRIHFKKKLTKKV
jgi:hypothetical protein